MITMARMSSNSSAMTSQLRLHLYDTPPTVCNDHAAFVQRWADDEHYIGYIDMGYRQFAGAGSKAKIADEVTTVSSVVTT
jgi:hypothetical protein